jgi:hypothetical protein
MQVLYQLSYGPIDVASIACHDVSLHPGGAPGRGPGQTSRQTATSRPWMVTWSAGTIRGA